MGNKDVSPYNHPQKNAFLTEFPHSMTEFPHSSYLETRSGSGLEGCRKSTRK
jgi:hypothetical protein